MNKNLSKTKKIEEKEGDEISCHAKNDQNFMNFQKISITSFGILRRLSDYLQDCRRAFQ